MRTAAAFAKVALALALEGCVLLTGSTSGYELAPAEGGTCDGSSACMGTRLECFSTADCDAGVCCLSVASLTSVQSTCQLGPCQTALGAQLCASSEECTGATCEAQECTIANATVTLRSCGGFSLCSSD
jgi:hypothetical protein